MRLVRDRSETERDPSAEEPDDDCDPLSVDEAGGVRERFIRADEVENGRVGAFELLWGGGLLRPELDRSLPLLGRRITHGNRRVRQKPKVLDPELAEPACPEDERARAGAEPVARVLDRAVRGQPTAT